MKNSLVGDAMLAWDLNGRKNFCNFNGVECDNKGNIFKIDISGYSVSGTIPEEICSYLPHLKILWAGHNDLHGNFPNSKSVKDQIRFLVYSMENAITDILPEQEHMVWLIDFHGFSVSNISVKVTRETAHVLQDHYPERLGVAVLDDVPKIFEPFWALIKPFLEPKTANKVKFVHSYDPNTKRIMKELFDDDELDVSLGGKDVVEFEIKSYGDMMREDDKKYHVFGRWKILVKPLN